MKRFAFTLSEILVTLSIVGVVAILTVPNITKNIYTKTDIATLQSTLKNLGDSVKAMMVNERVTRISDSSLATYGQNLLEGFYNKFLKVTKICEDSTDCFASEYKTIDGESVNFIYEINHSLEHDFNKPAVLPSGAALVYVTDRDPIVTDRESFIDGDGNFFNVFIVDINGNKSPNIIGVDMFSFGMNSRGEIGYFAVLPVDIDGRNDLRAVCRSGEDLGLSCAYILQTDNWDPKVITQKYPDEEVGE